LRLILRNIIENGALGEKLIHFAYKYIHTRIPVWTALFSEDNTLLRIGPVFPNATGEMDLGVGENLRGIKERFLALAWQEGVTSWIQGEEGNHNILVVDTLAFNLAGLKYLLVIFIPFGRRQLTV